MLHEFGSFLYLVFKELVYLVVSQKSFGIYLAFQGTLCVTNRE